MNISEDNPKSPAIPLDDKHFSMAYSFQSMARKIPQRNLTSVPIVKEKRNTHLAMIMMPEWGVFFPPYNLARLAGITRAAGYQTSIFDINIKSYRKIKSLKDMPYDPWEGSREFCWTGDWYFKELHHFLEPTFNHFIEQIVALQPQVIGFSLYYTNELPTNWMASQLKKRMPQTIILVGGPNAQKPYYQPSPDIDHVVQGEAEQIILQILDKVEQNKTIGPRFIKQTIGERIDLDGLPFPDYSQFNLNDYEIPNGISAEFSRGCTAKCTFCSETLFWKYRGRQFEKVIEEIEYQYHTHGIELVWFIDSLVNGNPKELRAFAQGIIGRGIKIKWQGYCRCDDRMDLDYYRDLKASGCHLLNYGIESGGQEVLDLMKKGIKIREIEKNLAYGKEVGILADTNWIIGFPNEEPGSFADTLTLLYRIRNCNLRTVSTGLTLMKESETPIGTNPEKFNMCHEDFMGIWITKDFKNSLIHRLIRIKSIEIFLMEINKRPITENHLSTSYRPNLKESFLVKFKNPGHREISYEKFNYEIIRPRLNPLADSIVNEIWPLLRLFWLTRGAYEITITFDPEKDLKEFGHRLHTDYSAKHYFKINDDGQWQADFSYKLILPPDPWAPWQVPLQARPWKDPSFTYNFKGMGKWKE